MADATFTFRLDTGLKTAFAAAAKAQDRTAAQLLRVLMREAVRRRHEARAHDAWFRGEVEQAVREADDPAVSRVPHQTVRKKRAQLDREQWQKEHASATKKSRRLRAAATCLPISAAPTRKRN